MPRLPTLLEVERRDVGRDAASGSHGKNGKEEFLKLLGGKALRAVGIFVVAKNDPRKGSHRLALSGSSLFDLLNFLRTASLRSPITTKNGS